jgi:hypothetical protein
VNGPIIQKLQNQEVVKSENKESDEQFYCLAVFLCHASQYITGKPLQGRREFSLRVFASKYYA